MVVQFSVVFKYIENIFLFLKKNYFHQHKYFVVNPNEASYIRMIYLKYKIISNSFFKLGDCIFLNKNILLGIFSLRRT